jgi:hypothetical protein
MEICSLVQGEMVLMRGVHNGTLYKLLGRVFNDGCNNSISFEDEEKKPYGL